MIEMSVKKIFYLIKLKINVVICFIKSIDKILSVSTRTFLKQEKQINKKIITHETFIYKF